QLPYALPTDPIHREVCVAPARDLDLETSRLSDWIRSQQNELPPALRESLRDIENSRERKRERPDMVVGGQGPVVDFGDGNVRYGLLVGRRVRRAAIRSRIVRDQWDDDLRNPCAGL